MDSAIPFDLIGLIISLLTNIVCIYLMIKPNKYFIDIFSVVDQNHNEINVKITNKGLRPFSIIGYTVGYGSDKSVQQVVLDEKLDYILKIKDGDIVEHNISRSKIVSSVIEKSLMQKHNQRLLLGVKLSTGKTFYKVTSIHHSIIKNDYLPNAANYIATDLFLGFKQMESKNELPLISLSINDQRQFKNSAHN